MKITYMKQCLKNLIIGSVIAGSLTTGGFAMKKENEKVPLKEEKKEVKKERIYPSFGEMLQLSIKNFTQVEMAIDHISSTYPSFSGVFTELDNESGKPGVVKPGDVRMDVAKWKQFIAFVCNQIVHGDKVLGQQLVYVGFEIATYYALSGHHTLIGSDENFIKNFVNDLKLKMPIVSPEERKKKVKETIEACVSNNTSLDLLFPSGQVDSEITEYLLKEFPECGVDPETLSKLRLEIEIGKSNGQPCYVKNKTLCAVAKKYTNLKGVVCFNCLKLTNRLLHALQGNPNLIRVSLHNICHSGKGLITDKDMMSLSDKCRKMRFFSINDYMPDVTDDAAITDEVVKNGIVKNWKSTIKKICLNGARISNDSIKELWKCKKIKNLTIEDCLPPSPPPLPNYPLEGLNSQCSFRLSDDVIRRLCQGPAHSQVDQSVTFYATLFSQFELLTIDVVAKCFSEMPKLKYLALYKSACDVGVSKLGEAFKESLQKQNIEVIGWYTPAEAKNKSGRKVEITVSDENGERALMVLVIKNESIENKFANLKIESDNKEIKNQKIEDKEEVEIKKTIEVD